MRRGNARTRGRVRLGALEDVQEVALERDARQQAPEPRDLVSGDLPAAERVLDAEARRELVAEREDEFDGELLDVLVGPAVYVPGLKWSGAAPRRRRGHDVDRLDVCVFFRSTDDPLRSRGKNATRLPRSNGTR